jgi:mannose/cellobiose epimerase-like protein (N-acyl-D-glucosamine 2-epimerase family)
MPHPLGGFVKDRAGGLPQRSNPHMHLLEAALAWIAVDDDPAWRRMADGIAALCLEKFIDPASGALRPIGARRHLRPRAGAGNKPLSHRRRRGGTLGCNP